MLISQRINDLRNALPDTRMLSAVLPKMILEPESAEEPIAYLGAYESF